MIGAAQQYPLPGIPRQEPEDDPATGANHMYRDQDEGVEKRLECHPQDGLLLGRVPRHPPGADRQPQRKPGCQGEALGRVWGRIAAGAAPVTLTISAYSVARQGSSGKL